MQRRRIELFRWRLSYHGRGFFQPIRIGIGVNKVVISIGIRVEAKSLTVFCKSFVVLSDNLQDDP